MFGPFAWMATQCFSSVRSLGNLFIGYFDMFAGLDAWRVMNRKNAFVRIAHEKVFVRAEGFWAL